MREDLIANHSMLLETFEALYDTVIIVDRDSNIVYVNPSFQKIMPGTKLLGLKVGEVEPYSQLLTVLKTGKPIYNYQQLVETLGLEAIVSFFPITREGEVIGAVAVGRTIPAENMYELVFNDNDRQAAHSRPRLKNALPPSFREIKGEDSSFVQALYKGAAAATTDVNVLVLGESGVGKEVFSRALHMASARRNQNFVVVNCAAIPDSLLESELFGYDPGAFTGASGKGKKGKFEMAHRGTLFLDEIGDFPPALQAKLLRAIQFKSFERVGGIKTVSVDIRIIAASNKDLHRMVKEGRFRADLYYRLNVFPIHIPPLRERKSDIVLLSAHFLEQIIKETGFDKPDSLTAETVNKLLAYSWPGNIRELKNAVEHAFVMATSEDSPYILPRHLPQHLQKTVPESGDPDSYLATVEAGRPLREVVEDFESRFIVKALEECRQNKSKAIKRLGISKGAFYDKLKKYQIQQP